MIITTVLQYIAGLISPPSLSGKPNQIRLAYHTRGRRIDSVHSPGRGIDFQFLQKFPPRNSPTKVPTTPMKVPIRSPIDTCTQTSQFDRLREVLSAGSFSLGSVSFRVVSLGVVVPSGRLVASSPPMSIAVSPLATRGR